MIGIVIFFLVAVHLALGMLMSLLPISQRLLGERFFRFNAAISLFLLAVAELVYGSAEKTRLSHEKALYWKAQIDGANPWLWGCGTLVALYLLSLPYRKRRVSRILLIGACFSGAVSLVLLASGLQSPAIPQSLGRLVFTLDFFLSALALGSVVICMILGHWYLIDPGMSVRHLKVMAAIFIAVVSARSLLGGYTSFLVWRDLAASGTDLLSNFVLITLVFYGQRVLFGLVAPLTLSWMIWQTVKIRSTQSATGILYVAVVFVLFGELLSHYLLVSTGYPL